MRNDIQPALQTIKSYFEKSEGLEMYMLELYQNPSYKDLVASGSLKEGKEFVSKITGYTQKMKMILFKVIK